MKRSSHLIRAIHAVVAGLVLAAVVVEPAAAYVGPGAGLTAIGVVLAMVAAFCFAVVGFVWYPVKRLLRKRGSAGKSRDGKPAAQVPADD